MYYRLLSDSESAEQPGRRTFEKEKKNPYVKKHPVRHPGGYMCAKTDAVGAYIEQTDMPIRATSDTYIT